MRLIDADALISIVETARKKAKTLTGMDFVMVTEDQPTIPAIPVEWLRGLKEKLYGNSNGLAYRMLLDVILNMWQKEQEAR